MSRYTVIGAALGVLLCATTMVLGFIYSFSQPSSFETSARLWVQPKLAEMVPSSYQTSLYAPLTAFFNSPIATAGEVLKSDVVLNEAVARIQEQLPAGECPTTGDLKTGLSVVSVSNADILLVRFRYKEPKICRLALDALLDAFIRVNSAQSASSATQSRIFLQKQLKKAQEDSLKAREQLKNFQDENKTLDFSEQSATSLKDMAELESSIHKTETGMAQLQTKIDYLQGQLKIKPEDAVVAERLALDEEVRGLQRTIGEGEVQLLGLRAKFRESHPRIQQTLLVIGQARKALRERVRELVGEIGANTAVENQVYTTDPVQQKLLADMVNFKADLMAETTKLSSLNQQLAATRQKLSELPTQQLRLAELMRSAEVSKQILSDTERNLHSITLLEAVATRASNIQILDRPGAASPTEQKIAYGVAVSILLGLALGGGTYYGVSLLNPAIQRIKDALNVLPLPIMGWVNRLSTPVAQRDILPGLEHLRVNLRPWLAKGHTRIVITSGDVEDGKTVLASGLAVSLSQSGLRVVLIDMNFSHPSLHEVFELSNSPGLSDYLTMPDPGKLPGIFHRVKDNLIVVTAGKKDVFAGITETRQFQDLLDRLQSDSDVLILDTGAANETADAFALLGRKVYLLVVARLGHTYQNSLRLVAGQLKHQEIAGAGLVFFEVDEQAIISALSMESSSGAGPPAAEEVTAESSHWS